ncbi:Helicase, C-terminal [Ostreococcus tauri]|uniref:Helicase, C-terminal n=1 Tax=Ostreococcus tauri TaxID=70448 RepID=A0A090N4G1_OSTTA|nr:Helicase, C-terminal [Ostreococcus tauri]CEF99808.1 Helicase, C-terminal [Ostreococcus tauri]|eukprot:XP_022840047.1 Helicase, C-terminal [Ostreococcus tauri]
MAGAIDLSFSTTACLEIFEVDYASREMDMPVVGKAIPSTERFHRIVWGSAGIGSTETRLGLIAGGLVDGTVNVYNPAKIVDGATNGAIITKLAKHQGAVRGLDFNTFSPNLLASGAEDGELCIWDLENPTKPSLYPALKSTTGGPTAGEVSFLQWNHKVQHILASSSLNGSTVVWDLKRQRPVISFTDPNSRRRCSAMQWNPEVATQLIVASDDDRSCTLQVWDLRNSISPAREFVAHSKGVLAMAWNLQDPALLLTCGKDNRTLCWDTEVGEVISELPASANWNFDVQWSKTAPGILSTSSFDGKITLHNMQQAGASQAGAHGVNSDFTGLAHEQSTGPKAPMKRAPNWLKRPCGATFGFGGKLLAHGAQLQGGPTASPTTISIMSVKSESTDGMVVKEQSVEFEQAVKNGEVNDLIKFCEVKRQDAKGEDQEAWTFMRILFAEDARREMLRHLEFGDALEAREKSLAALSMKDAREVEDSAPMSAPTSPSLPPVEDNDAFFDNLGDAPVQPPKPTPAPKSIPPPKQATVTTIPPPTAADFEIQRALIVGDYKAAVAACEKAERYADALILAAAGGPELWAEAQASHIARAPRPYMQVAAAVVGKNLSSLVKARPVSAWRETLAMLCTYAPGDEWGPLAEVLAEGLITSGDHNSAMLCYICAGNVDAAIKYWLTLLPSRNFTPKDLYGVVEKAVMLTRAAGQSESTQGFTSLITNYAEMLSSQGDLDSALDYLGMVPGSPGEDVNVLRDRIIRSSVSTKASTSTQVVSPAVSSSVPASSSPYQASPTSNVSTYGAPPPTSMKKSALATTANKSKLQGDEEAIPEFRNADVLVCTPARLLKLIKDEWVLLGRLRHVVVDEADEMLSSGFASDVGEIIKLSYGENGINRFDTKVQYIFAAATMREAQPLLETFPGEVEWVSTARFGRVHPQLDVRVDDVRGDDAKFESLCDALNRHKAYKTLIFANSPEDADELVGKLDARDVVALAFHGRAKERGVVLDDFIAGDLKVCVCTDLAARGIDFPDLHHVAQYGAAPSMEMFLHRCGRTARTGQRGPFHVTCVVDLDAETVDEDVRSELESHR